MESIRILLSRCAALFRRRKLDTDLDDELRAHLTMAMEEHIQRGMTRQQARTAALREFGGVMKIREEYRVRRGLPWLGQIARDLRFGIRQLHRSPGFALTAILTLAVGLGANTAVFSLINGLLLRPLPVPHADELTVVKSSRSDDTGANYGFSSPLFRAIEKRRDVFDAVAAFGSSRLDVRGSTGTVQVPGAMVSGDFFKVMEVTPLLGRMLTAADDREGSPNGFNVVITEGFWKSWFNGDAHVVGRTLTMANTPFTVVGVVPGWFHGADPTQQPEIYFPLWAEPVVDAPFNSIAGGYHSWWLRAIGRRKPGITLEQADAGLRASTNAALDGAQPDVDWIKDAKKNHFTFGAEAGAKGYTWLRMEFEKPLLVVFGLCCGMLLLACLNLASLLLARAAVRERELATRLALGASRIRLVQQLLMESLLIAVLGTAAGVVVAPVVSHGLAMMLLGQNRGGSVLDTGLDVRVMLFAVVVTGMMTVLVGLVPALRATSGELNEQIKRGSGSRGQVAGSGRRRMLPQLLMSMEVALALMLVVGAGLLGASLTRLYHAGLGFDPKGVVNLSLDMSKQPLHGPALTRWYEQFGVALRQLPGVAAVSFDGMTPLSGNTSTYTMQTSLSGGETQIYTNQVAPGYFGAMGIPMRSGRDFLWSDTKASGSKVVLNETAARKLFPGRNAVGQKVALDKENGPTVIAVVGDVHYASIQKAPPPGAYFPITQGEDADKYSYSAVVRLKGAAGPFAEAARKLVAQMAPDVPAPVMTTMSGQIDDSISSERMMAMLSVFFAGCALLVTAIGLYGTLAYATARRTSEIGIRMALGAQRLQVVLMVFRENAWVAIGGSLAGLIAALMASRVLASFLYGTSVRDPWVMVGSVAALIVIASAASLLPAMRAARIEPMVALRTE